MKKVQRILAALCIVFITLTALTFNVYSAEPSMTNFEKAQSYKPGQFPDISENEWFGFNKQRVVSNVYELGLMQGKGAMFDPNAGVTLAEAVTMAARLNNIYSGGDWEFHQSSPWYYTHLEYAVYKDIVGFETFKDLAKSATRGEMAYIFARALPEGEFAAINKIDALPDVNSGTPYQSEILRLYKSGILTGNDAYGTFGPNETITRAQAAAIITRIAIPSERVSFTPAKKDEAKDKVETIMLNIQKAPEVTLDLKQYDGGHFSMDLPTGWKLETVGEYENFGFRAYDPNNPARQIFFYGNMKYFLKSDAGKKAWETYLAYGGYGDAQVYADAYVLSPATTEQFFYTFNDYTSYAKKYGVVHNFAAFNDLEIVESTPRNSPIASNCVDDSIVRALFTQNDIPCEGLFAAGVADAMTSYMYNTDAGYYVVYYITGISAPADEFYALQNTLSQSLSSFSYSQSYIDQGVQRIDEGTKLALEIGKMLSQASDSYNQAWHDRQRPIDALSQKRSDSRLGYDRIYDTETGETYRAELGFYDDYDINRDDYANRNLQLVPDDGYSLYEKRISGYITK
jgi:hypothetical protein